MSTEEAWFGDKIIFAGILAWVDSLLSDQGPLIWNRKAKHEFIALRQALLMIDQGYMGDHTEPGLLDPKRLIDWPQGKLEPCSEKALAVLLDMSRHMTCPLVKELLEDYLQHRKDKYSFAVKAFAKTHANETHPHF